MNLRRRTETRFQVKARCFIANRTHAAMKSVVKQSLVPVHMREDPPRVPIAWQRAGRKQPLLILLRFSEFGGEEGIAAQLSETQQNQALAVRPRTPCVPILCPEVDWIFTPPTALECVQIRRGDLMTLSLYQFEAVFPPSAHPPNPPALHPPIPPLRHPTHP